MTGPISDLSAWKLLKIDGLVQAEELSDGDGGRGFVGLEHLSTRCAEHR
jgi:hypothetical protein